ncbi:MAG: BamA/TamA family outer membrane protein [Armatimonadetes bacterium]|jgi:outer membrane protein insertion porin family|nr:BamA/TamA family outer membrane protein [Armatimonadota bacterium]
MIKRVWRQNILFCLAVAVGMGIGNAPLAQAQQAEKVVAIEFRGNTNISTETLSAAIRTALGADLTKEQVDADVEALRKLGFFHEVSVLSEPGPGGTGAKVIFNVVEHPKVTAITITGNTKIPEAKLKELMLTREGQVFNENTFERDATAIQDYYRNQGYTLARVSEYDVSPEGKVTIPIAEGWVEAVRITSPAKKMKTKQRVILRELETKPGEVFHLPTLQSDLMQLRNLDYFEIVEPKVLDGSEPGKVVLVLDCKEKKTGTVSVGLGYSSRERLVGFADITENNFRGVGQQIGVRWEAGQFTNRSGYEFSFADPWMLGKRTSLGLQLYNRTTNRPLLVDDIDTWIFEKRKGIGVSVGKPFGTRNRVLLDFRSDDIGFQPVSGFPEPPADLLASEGRVTSLTLRGIRNTRDYDINPKRGALYSTSLEMAGGPLGGAWSFTKIGADIRHYVPIGRSKPDSSKQMVLATRLMAGAALGNTPLSENYWIGGAESLRGYREDQFHGTRLLLLSTELRVPFGSNLQGVTFFDYGYAWPKGTGFSLGDLQPAVGIGLRVVTQLGPLRLDYGFGKDGGRSHFSIGHVF